MVSVHSNYRVTGRCGRHRWMRRVKRGFASGLAPVGLRKPKPSDVCGYCHRLRVAVEAAC